ncbi:MAG: inorganic phosphate transporter [Clostridiales bacterium]|nr:inorganic phosphate transporter [Clostridiales bacterium]
MPTAFFIIVILMFAVIFVNGWTDAPNAIATVVSTRVMSPKAAVKMAVVFNFLGVLVMTYVNSKVADTLSEIVTFRDDQQDQALVVFAAAMFAIVIWAVAAWYFGIPTSESHALIAGVTGAAIALGGADSINMDKWKLVIIGLLVSLLGFVMGYISVKLIEWIMKLISYVFKPINRTSANKFFSGGQVFGAMAMSFMHGAQDGQKFIGTFILGMSLAGKNVSQNSWEYTILIVLCSLLMGIGTSVGGYRIIKAVGMDMVKIDKYQGFGADIAASICLLLSSLTGIPVSTTHTKTTAIMGVGAAKSIRSVNWGIVGEMFSAWILTFPGCGLIAFVMAKVFMHIF